MNVWRHDEYLLTSQIHKRSEETGIMRIFQWVFVLCLYFKTLRAIAVSKQVKLGKVSYYVAGTPEITVHGKLVNELVGSVGDSFLFPLTVINHSGELNYSVLESISEDFSSSDDVFSSYFLETVLVQSSDIKVTSLSNSSISTLNVSSVISLEGTALPNGPYFGSFLNGQLSVYRAYRLYSDDFATFQLGIVPSDENPNRFASGRRRCTCTNHCSPFEIVLHGIRRTTIGRISCCCEGSIQHCGH